ncbi:MAG: hypothetical protein ABI193_07225 [Minicystis sp.]
MSNLVYNGHAQAQHTLFTSSALGNGLLSTRQGVPFAGCSGFVLVGPDISLPAGITLNPPSAVGAYWDTLAGGGRPLVTFTTDANFAWKRGHLVNGEWSGPGNTWNNLTPLTPTANGNHKTVEQYMRAFCLASLAYDVGPGGYKANWYAIAYLVQCAVNPWSVAPANADLYSYAPEFIKVSWRAVTVAKPNLQPANIPGYLNGPLVFGGVLALPFVPPVRPLAIAGAVVPVVGNAAGGAVYGAPVGVVYPGAQANGFDGDIEVHQN